MSERGRARRATTGLAAAALLAVTGCATAPVRPGTHWLGVLPGDATLYLSLDVLRSADVLRAALGHAGPDLREVEPLLERTRRVYAAVEMGDGTSRRVSMVAVGTYPAGLIRSRLCCSRSWDNGESPAGKYYISSKAGLQVAVPSRHAVLASQGSIETLLARFSAPVAPAMPPEAAEGMDADDLCLYLPELPGGLPNVIGGGPSGAALPIREVWLEARRTTDRYEVAGTCTAASERDARNLVLLIRLALVAWMRNRELPDVSTRLRNVAVDADGLRVRISGLSFGQDEIAQVLLSLAGGTPP